MHLELEEVIHGEQVENPAVDAGLEKGVLVLRQADVVQPPHHPLVVQLSGRVDGVVVVHLVLLLLGLQGEQDLLPVHGALDAELVLEVAGAHGEEVLAHLDVPSDLGVVHVQAQVVQPRADRLHLPLPEGQARI